MIVNKLLDDKFTLSNHLKLVISKNTSVFFLANFLLQVGLFWPGIVESDAIGQYQMAISNIYTDHHPAFMSFVWRYLDKIYQGPGLLLTLNTGLLHIAAFNFFKAYEKRDSKAWTYLLMPWIPGIIAYGPMIYKDIAFAYSFIFCCSLLTKENLTNKLMPWWKILFFFLVLFYGSSVKFQAQFLSPILILWFVNNRTFDFTNTLLKRFIVAILLSIIFWLSLNFVNNVLVPNSQKSQSWQYVKLYDLAAISLKNNKDYIPEANKGPSFSMRNMKEKFHHYEVDSLVFMESPILIKRSENTYQSNLWYQWFSVVVKHPFDYLVHRLHNMTYIVFGKPAYTHIPPLLSKLFDTETFYYKFAYILTYLIFFFLVSSAPFMLLSAFYAYFGFKIHKHCQDALPLFYILSIAFGMLSILLFFSMAGVPRYAIISTSLMNCCHLMGWRCFKLFSQNKNLS